MKRSFGRRGVRNTSVAVAVALAGGLSLIGFFSFLIIAYMRRMPIVTGICAILVGTLAGFLYFNRHPARVFMGDVGSMALGSGLATIALLLNEPVLLLIMSGVFIIEMITSFLQMIALKRGHRLFTIAPLHHYLEARNWSETRITYSFWTCGVVLAIISIVLH